MNVLLLALLSQLSAPPPVLEGTATVPLSMVLPLSQPATGVVAPVVSAALSGQRLEARVTAEALEVEAHFTVEVLDASRASRVGLLRLTPGVMLVDSTPLQGATVAAHQGEVCLLSTRPGRYAFDVKLSVRATPDGRRRTARLAAGKDGLEGLLRVEVDPDRVALAHVADVYPVGGAWTVRWENVVEDTVAVVVRRPPLEPVVTSARAQFVSTVEGRGHLTAWYELRLDRDQRLAIDLPEGFRLERLLVNGIPLGAPAERHLELAVSPSRAGEQEGKVELGLVRDLGVFHLSGRLSLALPRLSWPVALVEASVHLPTVFQYRRVGGSLEPGELATWTPPAMPGRAITYRQHLVSASGPTLELEYFVDLDGRYFTAQPKGGTARER